MEAAKQSVKQIELDSGTYYVRLMDPLQALNLEFRLLQYGAAPFLMALRQQDQNAEVADIMPTVFASMLQLDADKLFGIFKELLAADVVSVKLPGAIDVEKLNAANFSRAFTGHLLDAHKVAWAVLQFNFADFIDGSAKLFGPVESQ